MARAIRQAWAAMLAAVVPAPRTYQEELVEPVLSVREVLGPIMKALAKRRLRADKRLMEDWPGEVVKLFPTHTDLPL